ncbi:transposon ty1-lr3 Gag-Pol polyprotein [Plakobranchus ocellatus]|uniref:Transposon ty1-lr3 Gag-Pol polyprotein n=1 Tax=Plakobranchus ocellatus TaxID=259542 RepID=A0AAV4CEZ2_9GAST|nr:transposon ty1-lr3 Gag-Pol polyprotein [Plakobranchus ocellatus]
MQPFGVTCICLVQNPKKLDNRGVKGTFAGEDRTSPAYLMFFSDTQEVRKIRCVKFNATQPEKTDSVEIPIYEQTSPDEIQIPNPTVQVEEPHNQQSQSSQEASNSRGLGKRIKTRPKYLDDYVVTNDNDETESDENDFLNSTFLHYCYNTVHQIPTCYKNAISCDDATKWHKAMNDEMSALEENGTFECTTLPPGRNAVGGRWVFNVKTNAKGEETFKARYVAKGFSQIPGIDFQETFSPTAHLTSVRTLVQCAVQNNQMVHQMDVKTAYLNAPIDCELYVQQPEGYEKTNDKGEKLVWKLKKSHYGLKQSGRNWNNLLHSHLIADGFVQSLVDTCVYFKETNDPNETCTILVWVDDILLSSKSETVMTNIKKSFSKHFHMKDLGPTSWFLGIELKNEKDSISMSQGQYIEKLLQKFKMENSKPKQTACDINVNRTLAGDKQTKTGQTNENIQSKHYREIVESLICIMTSTRPDICFIVTKLSQYLSNADELHMILAKHVLRDEISKGHMKVQYVPSEENPADVFTKPVSKVKTQSFRSLLMGDHAN